MCVLLSIMQNPIKYDETPQSCKIVLEFGRNYKTDEYNCDISCGTVEEVYDDSGEIIAVGMEDLTALGVTKATLYASHDVDLLEGS